MNMKSIAYRLQKALCERGRYIKINQVQSYIAESNRMVTKYMLIETEEVNGRNKNTTILETYKFVEVVQTLADIYGGG